jgi:hypothetical protein
MKKMVMMVVTLALTVSVFGCSGSKNGTRLDKEVTLGDFVSCKVSSKWEKVHDTSEYYGIFQTYSSYYDESVGGGSRVAIYLSMNLTEERTADQELSSIHKMHEDHPDLFSEAADILFGETTLNGKAGFMVTYSYTNIPSGINRTVRSVVVPFNSMTFSLSYEAPTDVFDPTDFENVLASVRFLK